MTEDVKLADVQNAIESLRAEVATIRERVSVLEAERATPANTLDEELITVLGAAIAAYLGFKPKIKQIRLLRSASWAQQGRATIQASHALKHS